MAPGGAKSAIGKRAHARHGAARAGCLPDDQARGKRFLHAYRDVENRAQLSLAAHKKMAKIGTTCLSRGFQIAICADFGRYRRKGNTTFPKIAAEPIGCARTVLGEQPAERSCVGIGAIIAQGKAVFAKLLAKIAPADAGRSEEHT